MKLNLNVFLLVIFIVLVYLEKVVIEGSYVLGNNLFSIF